MGHKLSKRELELNDLDQILKLVNSKAEIELERFNNIYNFESKDKYLSIIKRLILQIKTLENIIKFIPKNKINIIIDIYNSINKTLPISIYDNELENTINCLGTYINDIALIAFDNFEYYYENINSGQVINLIDLLIGEYQAYDMSFPANIKQSVIKIFDEIDTEFKNYIIEKLILIKNNFPDDINTADYLIKNLYFKIKETEITLDSIKLEHSKNEFEINKRTTISEINDIENRAIKYAYESQSVVYRDAASTYTHIIFFVFITISISILLKIILYSSDVKWQASLLFVAFILSLTGFLAYLIKERSRLVALQTYCTKNQLELSALPTYVYGLTEEQVQNLKIDLAKSYFRGYEEVQQNRDEHISQLPSAIDQFSKAITELKGLISK